MPPVYVTFYAFVPPAFKAQRFRFINLNRQEYFREAAAAIEAQPDHQDLRVVVLGRKALPESPVGGRAPRV